MKASAFLIMFSFLVAQASAQGNIMATTGRMAGPHASLRHGHFMDNASHRDHVILANDMRRIEVSRMLRNCDKRLHLRAKMFIRHQENRNMRQIKREIKSNS